MINKAIKYISRMSQKKMSLRDIAELVQNGELKRALFNKVFLEGDCVNGFSMYNKPLLISYPRSGTNWIRYFIEYMSGRATPNFELLVKKSYNYIIDRAHAGYMVIDNYDEAILVIRNYKECFIRQHGIELVKSYKRIEDFLNSEEIVGPPLWYISNIQKFDQFKGRKVLLYYEELLNNPEVEFSKLVDFFSFSDNKFRSFLNDIKQHKERSVGLYPGSKTKGDTKKTKFYSKMLTANQLQEFDAYYQKNYSTLYKNYLEHYKET